MISRMPLATFVVPENVWFHTVSNGLKQILWLYTNPLGAHGMGDSLTKLIYLCCSRRIRNQV